MRMLNSKKAGILDDFFIVSLIFIVGLLSLLFVYAIWLEFDDRIQALPSGIADAQTKSQIHDLGNIFLFFDKIQPFIFLSLWALVLIASMSVNPDHPAFFLVSIALLGCYTFFFILIVDIFGAIFDSSALARASQALGNSYFFMHNFHYIGFFVGLASIVWFYTKGNFGGSSNRGIAP